MKIRITKSRWWYADKVGEEFEVIEQIDLHDGDDDEIGKAYVVIDPTYGERSWVLSKDCAILVDVDSPLWNTSGETPQADAVNSPDMVAKYPKYYKDVSDVDSVDVYKVHEIFGIDDPSGAIHHASKKLLLSGTRTGGKSKYDDVKEARDTLTRWLEMQSDSD